MSDESERAERRLVEETSKLRVELAGVEVRLTERIAHAEGTITQDLGALEVRIEKRMGDLLKWSFAFWVGQIIAMTAIMNALLR